MTSSWPALSSGLSMGTAGQSGTASYPSTAASQYSLVGHASATASYPAVAAANPYSRSALASTAANYMGYGSTTSHSGAQQHAGIASGHNSQAEGSGRTFTNWIPKIECCGSGSETFFPDPELFVLDPARMKEQINKILFLILGLWILDCSTVGL